MLKLLLSMVLLSTYIFSAALATKTGQFRSYDSSGNIVSDGSLKDDAYYQMGVAHNYSRKGDVVRDHGTGLSWQDNEIVSISSYDIEEYCHNLSLNGLNWRVPSIFELTTLVDYSRSLPAIDEDIFKHTHGYRHAGDSWRGYHVHGGLYKAVYFTIGDIDGYDAGYLRCVSGEKLKPSEFERDDSKEIVTDITTGLQWQDNMDAKTVELKWEEAIDYCENLTLGGFYDWRLPNIKELQSMVDYTRSPALDTSVFQYYNIAYMWSSTTYVNNHQGAWILWPGSGQIYLDHNNKDYSENTFRCVRDVSITPEINDNKASVLIPIIMYLLND